MKIDPTIELPTPRLHLRRLAAGDAAALCAYRALPEVARFQSWTGFERTDAERLIEQQSGLEPDTPGTWFQLAIVERASGALIGDIGLHFHLDDPRQAEVGITLAPSSQGRGYAAEALERVLAYLFEDLDKHRAMAITDAENQAAAALFRRLGFRQEAHYLEHVWFKGAYGSEYLFAMLQREWRARRSRSAASSV